MRDDMSLCVYACDGDTALGKRCISVVRGRFGGMGGEGISTCDGFRVGDTWFREELSQWSIVRLRVPMLMVLAQVEVFGRRYVFSRHALSAVNYRFGSTGGDDISTCVHLVLEILRS